MVMVIKEIKNLTDKEFEELSNIYLSTFSLENAKHLDIYLNHIYDMLKNDSRYHLYVAIKDRSMIGISLLYIFEELKMALLDYMAVLPTFQRRGVGGKLFEFTNNELNHLLLDNIGMLVEVPKENASELISLILYIQMCMTIERMIYLAILLLPCPMSLILKN
jgi:GNAT superfamily N-acetyltransferase